MTLAPDLRLARPAIAAGLLAAVLVAGCDQPEPAEQTPPAAESVAPGGGDQGLRYACNDAFPFEAALLARAGTAETADNPQAAALRDHLARDEMDIAWLPDAGWILAGEDGLRAEFVAPNAEGGLFDVTLERAGGSWKVTGWGGCQPQRVLPPGLGEASWIVAPGEAIGPATITFGALVTERDCASGQSSEGRVVGPEILQLGGEVLVTFAVRPLGDGAHTCQGNPPTRVQVTLPGPLGPRRLLDGGTLPPREPVPDF